MKRIVLALAALSFVATGCMGEGESVDGTTTVVSAAETETGAAEGDTGMAETTTVPEPPPVTHAQFVRQLTAFVAASTARWTS